MMRKDDLICLLKVSMVKVFFSIWMTIFFGGEDFRVENVTRPPRKLTRQ